MWSLFKNGTFFETFVQIKSDAHVQKINVFIWIYLCSPKLKRHQMLNFKWKLSFHFLFFFFALNSLFFWYMLSRLTTQDSIIRLVYLHNTIQAYKKIHKKCVVCAIPKSSKEFSTVKKKNEKKRMKILMKIIIVRRSAFSMFHCNFVYLFTLLTKKENSFNETIQWILSKQNPSQFFGQLNCSKIFELNVFSSLYFWWVVIGF